MRKFYAPKARPEAEALESVIWNLVKDRFPDNTKGYSPIYEHPTTGKFGIILPEDFESLGLNIQENEILTWDEMNEAGWFPVEDE
jgi:hypothetical protein